MLLSASFDLFYMRPLTGGIKPPVLRHSSGELVV